MRLRRIEVIWANQDINNICRGLLNAIKKALVAEFEGNVLEIKSVLFIIFRQRIAVFGNITYSFFIVGDTVLIVMNNKLANTLGKNPYNPSNHLIIVHNHCTSPK